VSFLMGKNEQLSGTDAAGQDLWRQLIGYVKGQGFAGLNPGTSVDSASAEPYQQLFRKQNAQNLGQAKESLGNLTGSGVGTILGREAGSAATEQGAFLANLFENRRQQDANRFMQLVLGSLGSPAGQVQNVYRPGFLDYAGQGATALAGGGAFNGLFGSGRTS
jgi:hypothetical protein